MIQVAGWVFIGGGVGSVARLAIGRWLVSHSAVFPWGTLAANLISSVILGAMVSWKARGNEGNSDLYFLLTTGFCGGFSTFSTFSYEVFALLQEGRLGLAFAYAGLSLLAGLLGVFAGFLLLRSI